MFMYNDFSKNLIKEYKYWTIYAHTNQSYLGRCVVWCKRDDTLNLTEQRQKNNRNCFWFCKT